MAQREYKFVPSEFSKPKILVYVSSKLILWSGYAQAVSDANFCDYFPSEN